MKLKLDENLPRLVAEKFTGHLHDVDTVTDEGLAGAGDSAVLGAVRDEERMAITLDRGFGDVRRYPPGSHPGIIVLRAINQDPASITRLVERFLEVRKLEDLRGCIVVVEPEQIRIRRSDSPGSS